MDMPMQMTFYWSHQVTILFSQWKTTNQLEYTLSCIFFFLLAIGFEWLTTIRNNLKVSGKANTLSLQESEPLLYILVKVSLIGFRKSQYLKASHLQMSILYTLQIFLSYILMLVIMTYNGGLFMSCILGYGAGYWLFAARRTKEAAASCHVED